MEKSQVECLGKKEATVRFYLPKSDRSSERVLVIVERAAIEKSE